MMLSSREKKKMQHHTVFNNFVKKYGIVFERDAHGSVKPIGKVTRPIIRKQMLVERIDKYINEIAVHVLNYT